MNISEDVVFAQGKLIGTNRVGQIKRVFEDENMFFCELM